MQKNVIEFPRSVFFISSASVGGKKESDGPIGSKLDITDPVGDDRFGQNTWETAESEMQRLALTAAISKSGLDEHSVDAVFAGDLQNQCVGAAYGLLGFDIPYVGLYGACSTCAESIILSSIFVSGCNADTAAAVTSSHFCSAERQFRSPIEYGGQRSPASQWTVTGAGAFMLSCRGNASMPKVTEAVIGRSVDKGINDLSNMGAAMAPAAVDTLTRYFDASGTSPDAFDMIITGDLGAEGTHIFRDFMASANYPVSGVHADCGLMIYDRRSGDRHSGGSGCGCSAVVLASEILPRMYADGDLHNVLFMATGALMSTASVEQGLNIPGICHLVHIVGGEA